MEVECKVQSRLVHAVRDGRWDLLGYAIWTRLKGLDLRSEFPEESGAGQANDIECADSGGPDLARVLRMLDITPQHRIVDLGSGKGGGTLTIARFPFGEIVGVEVSERLVRIARRNAARLGLQNVTFICQDASQFTDLDRFTHIHMFNPFHSAVVRTVMKEFVASVRRCPRPLTLIYKYPGSPDHLVDQDVFPKVARYQFKGSHPFSIYSARVGG